ncbi:hypothetical protein ACPPVO_50430 [Dactylosporangium sp. McL0621]|uniref:hypothetical protein n=1 Tax=Dactylosporangium sp. McL0621 TaxID=3415678 RepID=UPI003CEDFE51
MTDQFDHLLHDAFDDFAAAERTTAAQAPGTAAVRRTVAVRRRNRYAMLSVLGAVLVAIPVAAYAANPRGNNSPPLPGASVTVSSSPPATATASPAASEGANPGTDGSTSQSTTGTPADPVPGMYLFRVDKHDGTITNDVLHRAPGGEWQKVASVKSPTVALPAGPPLMTMSPDRKHVAWFLDGKLQVSALDGSQVKTLATVGDPVVCVAATWAADSRHLLFQAKSADGTTTTTESIGVDGAGRKTLGPGGDAVQCGPASVDGSTAYVISNAAGPRHLMAVSGGTSRTIAVSWPGGRQPVDVVAADKGSTRLLVATVSDPGCGCAPPKQYVIVDTANGKVTRLDNAQDKAGSSPASGAFTADGKVVLIADRNRGNGSGVDLFLTVFGADGAILGSAPLPDMEVGYLVGFGA